MACPPTSAPSCREDQFLVEVRGDKPCCYSYLCGKFFYGTAQVSLKQIFKHSGEAGHHNSLFNAFIIYSNNTEFIMFSVWVVCESCIEPIPSCSHGEILAVDLNNTSSCCPHYHCGKCSYPFLRVSLFLSLFSKSPLCFLKCVTVCDVNLCPESSVSCPSGVTLVQTTVEGQCCPQYHCGTPSKYYTQYII